MACKGLFLDFGRGIVNSVSQDLHRCCETTAGFDGIRDNLVVLFRIGICGSRRRNTLRMLSIISIIFGVLLMSVKCRPATHVPATSFCLYRTGTTPKQAGLANTVPYISVICKILCEI